MKDYLITGVHGQLGRALIREVASRGLTADGCDLDTLDITDATAVTDWIVGEKPKTVVNCAAFTAVDECEQRETEALAVNGTAVAHLTEACNRIGARFVQISTDYVFSGDSDAPYPEGHPTGPKSAYGRTKLQGELAAEKADTHLIVRTAWLYGRGGKNFVEAIRGQIEKGRDQLKVVADQYGNPTFCDDLAAAICDLTDTGATGIVHAVNSGSTNWHGFAVEIARQLGAQVEIEAVTTEEFPRPAPRPAFSVLDTSRLQGFIGHPMPDWRDALRRYLDRT